MSKSFDATTKYLIEAHPAAWLEFIGLPLAPVEIISADLATITTEADRVLHVLDPDGPYLLHIEFQASYDLRLDGRVLRYAVLLDDRHHLSVESVVILLRPEADGPEVRGRVERSRRNGRTVLDFRYTLIRLWQLPVEEILRGSLGTLPFAPLVSVSRQELPEVVRQMQARIEQEATPAEEKELWSATYVLMGLKYPTELTNRLLQGVRQMKESMTYQAILEEGRKEGEAKGRKEGEAKGRAGEARSLILRLGSQRFGPPDATTRAAVGAIKSVARLEALADRLLQVESWEELLR